MKRIILNALNHLDNLHEDLSTRKYSIYVPVIINGKGGCGKDAFIEHIKKYCHSTVRLKTKAHSISTVEPIRTMLKDYEIYNDDNKTFELRKLMVDIKQSIISYDNCMLKYIKKSIDKIVYSSDREYRNIIFIHSREPAEIEAIRDKFHAITLLIRRDEVDNIDYNNNSDNNVTNYNYDIIISNNQDLDRFKVKAELFTNLISGLVE